MATESSTADPVIDLPAEPPLNPQSIIFKHIIYDEYPTKNILGNYFENGCEELKKILNNSVINEVFNSIENGDKIRQDYMDIIERSKILYNLNDKPFLKDIIKINRKKSEWTEEEELVIDSKLIIDNLKKIVNKHSKYMTDSLKEPKDINYLYCGFITKTDNHAIGLVYEKYENTQEPKYKYLLSISNSGNGADYHSVDDNYNCNAIMKFKITEDELKKILRYIITFRGIISVECFYTRIIDFLVDDRSDYLENSKRLVKIIKRKLQMIGNCSTLSILTPLIILTDNSSEKITTLSESYQKYIIQ